MSVIHLVGGFAIASAHAIILIGINRYLLGTYLFTYLTLLCIHSNQSSINCVSKCCFLILMIYITYGYDSSIQTYGTHIIVGVAVGGQDLVCVKHKPSSTIPPEELKKIYG